MAALSRMSFRVAMPRSGIPSRDIVVPAPVYSFLRQGYRYKGNWGIYHVQALEAGF